MNHKPVRSTDKNAMQLQSVGWVQGTPAGQIKVGDVLMWNFGHTDKVVEIIKPTDKSLTCVFNIQGETFERRFLRTRLVCIMFD